METRIYKVPVKMTCWFTVDIPVDIEDGWDESEVMAVLCDSVSHMDAMPMADEQYNFHTHYAWEQAGGDIEVDFDHIEGDFEFSQDLDDEDSE